MGTRILKLLCRKIYVEDSAEYRFQHNLSIATLTIENKTIIDIHIEPFEQESEGITFVDGELHFRLNQDSSWSLKCVGGRINL